MSTSCLLTWRVINKAVKDDSKIEIFIERVIGEIVEYKYFFPSKLPVTTCSYNNNKNNSIQLL